MTTRFIHLSDFAKTPSLRECLTFLLSRCELFTLVTRGENDCGVMRYLAGFQTGTHRTSSWPGTTIVGHTARLHTYRFTDGSAAVLWKSVRTFWNLVQPKQPEDFVAYRTDGSPFFVTIAHEGAAYFQCEQNQESTLRDELWRRRFPLVANNALEGVNP